MSGENALADVEEIEVFDPPVDAPVDAPAEPVESPEQDDVEAQARRLGWKPEEDWKGDKTGWVDASTFMDHARTMPAKVKRLEEDFAKRLEAIEKANAAALKRQQDAHKAEMTRIRADQRKAVEVGDTEAYDRLEAQREQLQQPQDAPEPRMAPQVQDWTQRNAWFNRDPVMRAAALALADEAVRAGMTDPAQQLAYVDREMPQQFPHKFQRKAPPLAIDPGSSAAPRKRGKSASDLPPEARSAGSMFVRDGIYKSLDEYAKDYFEENPA